MRPEGTYGLLAEMESPEALVEAARKAREAGYRRMDGYSPMPVEGLDEALGVRKTRLPRLVFAAGLTGTVTGFVMQYGLNGIHYPLNIGGKPLWSWPSFVVIAFELTILFAAATAVFGMLAANRLPEPYHALFNVDRFAAASQDAFFLCIEARDPKFDENETRAFLKGLGAKEVWLVPR